MDPQTQPVAARISGLLAIREHLLGTACRNVDQVAGALGDNCQLTRYARIKGYSSSVGRDDEGRGTG